MPIVPIVPKDDGDSGQGAGVQEADVNDTLLIDADVECLLQVAVCAHGDDLQA